MVGTAGIGIAGLFLLGVVIALAIAYLATRSALGPQAAGRTLTYTLPWILLGALLSVLLAFAGPYGLTVLYALYSIGVIVWIASWPMRKKQAGPLLLRVGSTLLTKLLFWLGLLQVGMAIAMTFPLLDRITGGLVTPSGLITGLVAIAFWWANALLFIAIGQSNLELHEHGLTHTFAWQPWDRIAAFGWDDDKPSTLILKAKPRTPLSRKYITMSIPDAQVAEVDRLLEDYLLETDLAAEMDGDALFTS
ncbi:MAG: hypothetical protein AAFN12_05055 [Cyanobacteria bacterium J06560_2]